jgi:hypothetical protein
MSRGFADAARQLLAAGPGEGASVKDVADRAERASERFAQHLARLVGGSGVETLWKRSLVLASANVPWLSSVGSLREAMEQQAPDAAIEGFVAVFSTFVYLLQRLIGVGLVERLLAEVWPAIFSKETP